MGGSQGRKPRAFPVLCFRLTFKIYLFKMLIIMSDISCATESIVAAEGETFFVRTLLTAKEGWLKAEQRWAAGSSRGDWGRTHLVHSYEGGEGGLQQNKPALHTGTVVNMSTWTQLAPSPVIYYKLLLPSLRQFWFLSSQAAAHSIDSFSPLCKVLSLFCMTS